MVLSALSPLPVMAFCAVLVALTGGSYFTTSLGGGIGMFCLAIFYVERLKAAQQVNEAALAAKGDTG